MPAQCCPCWLWLTGEGEVSVFKQVQRKNELHANSDIITLAKAGSREVYVSMGSHFLLKTHFDRLETQGTSLPDMKPPDFSASPH